MDWSGGILADMPEAPEGNEEIEFVPSALRGRFDRVHTMRVQDTGRWRAIFEYAAEDGDPIDLRGYLRRRGEALSETWLFKYFPTER